MCQNFKNILYHGTVSLIHKVDVTKGRGRKDFGKGFYMAESKQQAIGMMHKKYKESIVRNRNKLRTEYSKRLYEIHLDVESIAKLKVKIFPKADIEWLDFILMCREQGDMPHDYDLVIGPTADDDTMLCLKSYRDGLYGKVGTVFAKKRLLEYLETENLGIQYYIGKQDVANKLIVEIKEIDWEVTSA